MNKNWHLKKYLSAKIPEPKIQADDAWAQMSDLLKKTPVPQSSAPQPSMFQLILKYSLGVLAGLGGVCTLLFLLTRKQDRLANVPVNRSGQQQVESATKSGSTIMDRPPGSFQKAGTQVQGNTAGRTEWKDGVTEVSASEKSSPSVQEQNENLKTKTGIKEGLKTKKHSNPHQEERPIITKTNPVFSLPDAAAVQSRLEKLSADQSKLNPSPTGKGNYVSPNAMQNRRGAVENSASKDDLSRNEEFLKNDLRLRNNLKQQQSMSFSLARLTARPLSFSKSSKNLINVVVDYKMFVLSQPKESNPDRTFSRNWHAGLEWNVASSLKNTKYIFSGVDSLKRPYLLLIPGIWVSKQFKTNQLLTFSLSIYQPYLGAQKVIQKLPDSTTLGSTQIRFIKAAGVNVSLQYERPLLSKWKLSAAIAYSHFGEALFEKRYVNYANQPLDGSLFSVHNQDLKKMIRSNMIAFKPGLGFHWQRYQLGVNLIIPLSNISSTSVPVRSLNGQVYFRLGFR